MATIDIERTLGLPAEDILAGRHNLWVGVSSSPWFREPSGFETLVRWALEHTREELLVWIPGRMYSSNYFHIDGMTRARALRTGFKEEDHFRTRVEKLLAESSRPVRIIGYDDLLTPVFVRRRSILYREFSKEGGFYQRIMEVAEEYLRARMRSAPSKRVEAVAVYQLQELPMFIAPVRTIDSDVAFVAEIYPGLGKFDRLARDIVEGNELPELTERLELTEQCGIVSVKLVP